MPQEKPARRTNHNTQTCSYTNASPRHTISGWLSHDIDQPHPDTQEAGRFCAPGATLHTVTRPAINAAARGGLVFILFTFGPANLVLRASRSDCTPPIRTTFSFEAVQNPGLTMRSLPKSNRQRCSVCCHRAPMRLDGSTQKPVARKRPRNSRAPVNQVRSPHPRIGKTSRFVSDDFSKFPYLSIANYSDSSTSWSGQLESRPSAFCLWAGWIQV